MTRPLWLEIPRWILWNLGRTTSRTDFKYYPPRLNPRFDAWVKDNLVHPVEIHGHERMKPSSILENSSYLDRIFLIEFGSASDMMLFKLAWGDLDA